MKHIFFLGILSIALNTYAMETKIATISDQPLHQAVECNEVDTMQLLLGQGIDANHLDKWGATPLHYVRSLKAAQILFDNNAAVYASEQKNPGHTPLHNIVQNDTEEHHKIALFLLSKGADVNAKNKFESCPLDLVNWNANPVGMVKLLLEKGAQLKSGFGRTPGHLDQAIFHGHADMVETLLGFGANPNAITRDSQMLLEGKVERCDRSKIAALLQAASAQKPH